MNKKNSSLLFVSSTEQIFFFKYEWHLAEKSLVYSYYPELLKENPPHLIRSLEWSEYTHKVRKKETQNIKGKKAFWI